MESARTVDAVDPDGGDSTDGPAPEITDMTDRSTPDVPSLAP